MTILRALGNVGWELLHLCWCMDMRRSRGCRHEAPF